MVDAFVLMFVELVATPPTLPPAARLKMSAAFEAMPETFVLMSASFAAMLAAFDTMPTAFVLMFCTFALIIHW